MKTEVTPAMVAEYQERGFIRVDDFLDGAELEAWREALDEAVEQRGGVGAGGLKLPTVDDAHPVNEEQWKDSAPSAVGPYTQRLQLWRTHDHFRRIFLDAQLGEMVTKLACVSGMRIWHDQTLIKEPWAPPSTFHLDNTLWSFHHHESISIWVALDDVTLQNGCKHAPASLPSRGLAPSRAARRHVIGLAPSRAARRPIIAHLARPDCCVLFRYELHPRFASRGCLPRARVRTDTLWPRRPGRRRHVLRQVPRVGYARGGAGRDESGLVHVSQRLDAPRRWL
jgi:hypothetical protein